MKRTLIIVAVILAGLGALAIRVVVEGRTALAAGDEALARGDTDDAVASWEASARWYLPLAAHVDDAYARLIHLTQVDHRHALAAWRSVRSAALATRGLWSPHADELLAANAAIAELASRDPEGALAAGPDAAARKTWHTDRLARDPGPSRSGVFLSVLGLAGFLAGIALLLRRTGPTILGGVVAALGTVGWIIGLALA